MDSLQREIKKLKNLKQYRGKSKEELASLAKANLEKQDIIGSLTFCINDEEKKFASNLLEKYLEDSSLEKTAEKDTLRILIDNSVLIERIKQTLNTEYNKSNPYIPHQMLDQLQNLNKQNLELKDKLGLTSTEKEKDFIDYWNQLYEKALAYYKENAGCNIARCPYCQKLFYILKNMKEHHTEKIPMFKKTMLYNKKLFELYEQKRITKEEITNILGVSEDYISYIYSNIYENEKKQT